MTPRPLPQQLSHYSVTVAPKDRLPREGETILSRASVADYKVDENGCWVWQKMTLRGYPQSGAQKPHRLYYERANGAIPPEHDIHHLCKNRACLNPDHLEALHRRQHDVEHFLHERTGLTLDDLKEMRRRMRDVNQSVDALAAEYGVSSETGHVIKRGERWVDLIGESGCVVVDNPRDCPQCGATVERKNRNAIYCSKKCRERFNDLRYKARAKTGKETRGV